MHSIASTENARTCQEVAITVRATVKIEHNRARTCQAMCAHLSSKDVSCADGICISASPIRRGNRDTFCYREKYKQYRAALRDFAPLY